MDTNPAHQVDRTFVQRVGVTGQMTQHRRPPLFVADPHRPGSVTGAIFPRPVEAQAIRLLWMGLSVMLAVLAGVLLLWSHGGI